LIQTDDDATAATSMGDSTVAMTTSVPSTTIGSMSTSTTRAPDEEDEDDEDDDDEETDGSKEDSKPKSITSENDEDEADGKSSVDETKKSKDEDDDEDDDDDENSDEDEGQSCDGKFSSFVRTIKLSDYLPDDFWDVSDYLNHNSARGHVRNINHTLVHLNQHAKWLNKVFSNKDLQDAAAYIGSVMMEFLMEVDITPDCMADLATMGQAVRNFEMWALKSEFHSS